MFLFSLFLVACGDPGKQEASVSGPSQEAITYSTNAKDVVIRTFYGGGKYGSFSLAPQISIYGDGTYILGVERQGKLPADGLQKLMSTIIEENNLLGFQRRQFYDIPDQNATFLELFINGKRQEFIYGSFGNQEQKQQDLDEYKRLRQAITSINEAITGPLTPYENNTKVVFVRQMFNPPPDKIIEELIVPDFSLSEAAVFMCGKLLDIDSSPVDNRENGCMKYTVPKKALLLDESQMQALLEQMQGESEQIFREGSDYFALTVRPLLPDELPSKTVAMFGSQQLAFKPIEIHEGPMTKE